MSPRRRFFQEAAPDPATGNLVYPLVFFHHQTLAPGVKSPAPTTSAHGGQGIATTAHLFGPSDDLRRGQYPTADATDPSPSQSSRYTPRGGVAWA